MVSNGPTPVGTRGVVRFWSSSTPLRIEFDDRLAPPLFCSQLPYDQTGLGSSAAYSELVALTNNADVEALRDTYAADLVVLVGSFQGICGLGYDDDWPIERYVTKLCMCVSDRRALPCSVGTLCSSELRLRLTGGCQTK